MQKKFITYTILFFFPVILGYLAIEYLTLNLPMSYQIGGYTLFLPRRCMKPINMSFEEAMKLVLTGAITKTEDGNNS